jgi:putative ABC transporter-associated repeat protein
MTTLTRRPRRVAAVMRAGTAALALTLMAAPAAAFAVGKDDPNLNQTLDDLAVVHGERTLDIGHVDMGPKFVDGKWTFLIHDDVAKADAAATSVWRYPDETVFHVRDQAQMPVPDDAAYSFVGADPGASVWVVPQTQNREVVWLGWNTQDPEVMKTIDRGVTLSLTGVQGPGTVTTYLQSGSFGEPQLLWDSRVEDAQPIWVDVNTHTHANWVFTKPGVYLLQLKATADLVDGSSVSDTQVIRFAVGTATTPASALAATWNGAAASGFSTPADGQNSKADSESATDPLVLGLIGAIGLVASLLVVALIVVIVRGNRAKRRALASRAAASGSDLDRDAEDAR